MNSDLLIANITKQVPLSTAEQHLFTSLLEPRTVYKKEYLLRQGDICRHDYFVNTGCLKICYTDEKGIECVTKFAIENWWVIDIESYLYASPCFYYYQAVEDTTLLQISKTNLEHLLQTIPALQQFMTTRWQNSFIALQHRFVQSLSLSAEEKYRLFREKYPGLELRIPQKLVAAYLGITPEFLSRLRKKAATDFS
ncbi:Crp/Fnr family transcriptional regulator [Deminuibacter soli]|uniref:Crp/Fnr family transcriptional regulator n=1 Tax=Deminuibacter soli TaxID=2291815 RepID=A0A3E1NK61_9BACT|nr:Crp/Fnr family transcriptional regulator [Deminuibacter soli]RFM28303.1 Crp/Fnr family transcriptional regulator [Deminuibacter soli]